LALLNGLGTNQILRRLGQNRGSAKHIAWNEPKKKELSSVLSNEEMSRMTCGDQEELICTMVLMNHYFVGAHAFGFGGCEYLLKLARAQSMQEPRSQVCGQSTHIASEQ
jgi:hypothetical protein